MTQPIDYQGQRVLLTGAASGIGRALAAELAARGAHPLLTDINAQAAEEAAQALRAAGLQADARGLDVRDGQAWQQLIEETWERAPIDLFFNNAGIGQLGLMRDLSPQDWQVCLDVNLHGMVHGVQAVYPRMLARKRGRIVLTASLSGLVPTPGLGPYTLCKHAMVGLAGCLRAEAAVHGVSVHAVCPGFVATGILQSMPCVKLPASAAGALVEAAGGAIPIDQAVASILAGLEADEPLIVFPEGARKAVRAFQHAPERYHARNLVVAQQLEAARQP